jgi:hypothetical protein
MHILLDIDGVMVPAKCLKQPELLLDRFPSLSTKIVKALSELIGPNDSIVLFPLIMCPSHLIYPRTRAMNSSVKMLILNFISLLGK